MQIMLKVNLLKLLNLCINGAMVVLDINIVEGTVVIVENRVAVPLGIDMMFAALLTIVVGQLMELMTANVITISLLVQRKTGSMSHGITLSVISLVPS